MPTNEYKSVAVMKRNHDKLRLMSYELNLPITQVIDLLLYTYEEKENEAINRRSIDSRPKI